MLLGSVSQATAGSPCLGDWTLCLTSSLSDVLPWLICTLTVWSICPGLASEAVRAVRLLEAVDGCLEHATHSHHPQIVLSMVYDARQ